MEQSSILATGLSRDQADAAAFLDRRLQLRLQETTANILDGRLTPGQVITRLDSLLALLKQAHSRPRFHAGALALIRAVHPLPIFHGHLSIWQPELRFAIDVCERTKDYALQTEFLCELSITLSLMGDSKGALECGWRALDAARQSGAVVRLAQACMALIANALQYTPDQVSEFFPLIAEIETQLATVHTVHIDIDDAERSLIVGRIDGIHALIARYQKSLDQAVLLAEQAVTSLKDCNVPLQLASAYHVLGLNLWSVGKSHEALQALQAATTLFEETGNLLMASRLKSDLGLCYWSTGNLAESHRFLQDAICLSESTGLKEAFTRQVGNLALVCLSRGQFDEADRYLGVQLATATQVGLTSEIGRALGNRGIVRAHQGDYTAAITDLQFDADWSRQNNHREGLCACLVYLSVCHTRLRDDARAIETAQEAYELSLELHSPPLTTIALRALAECQADRKSRRRYLKMALELAQQTHRRLDEAGCLLSLAHLAEQDTSRQQLWTQGVDILTAIGALSWIEQASPDNPPFVLALA